MPGATLSGVAVVTGGASGIGAACCRELVARGAQVVLLDRDERVHAVARELNGRAFIADVSDDEALERCAESIETEVGPVEILVNSAGIIQQPLPPEQLSMKVWDEVVRVDQRGTYTTSVVFGKRMAARRHGCRHFDYRVSGRRMGTGRHTGQRRVTRLHTHTSVAGSHRQRRTGCVQAREQFSARTHG